MRFRKKPVVIEAVVWTGDNWYEVATWIGLNAHPSLGVVGRQLRIPTLEGDHLASPGDYIIRGVQGEFYPCKPDIFRQTYDPVLS